MVVVCSPTNSTVLIDRGDGDVGGGRRQPETPGSGSCAWLQLVTIMMMLMATVVMFGSTHFWLGF
ncbi:hypothetical protein HanPSC8_Chr01g0006051 [Helianthus annuus]|nr:hypothetical protein HanPSC8_Chr01g0006051 [Helianthus annuus]